MMDASSISAMIRAKKKKMIEDDGLVKLSGIPEDATDILINENHIEGEKLDENVPLHGEDEAAEGMAPESEMQEMSEEEHAVKMGKIRSMMARMSR